jgi:AcrR family transcriptional regulator
MTTVAGGRPGRPTSVDRDDALAFATARFLAGERVDVKAIALELGLARATMHRWFKTRDALLGEVLACLGEARLGKIRGGIDGGGARALLDCFDAFNRELASARGLQALFAHEHERTLRILTSSGGSVQPRMVAAIKRLIDDEIEAGRFSSTVAPDSLAYAIVRLAESFLYNDAIVGIRGDTERLREVEAALLGVPAR